MRMVRVAARKDLGFDRARLRQFLALTQTFATFPARMSFWRSTVTGEFVLVEPDIVERKISEKVQVSWFHVGGLTYSHSTFVLQPS